jgi:hypothetical protein
MVLSLITGILGANASKKAANTQAAAARDAANAQLQGTRESNAMLRDFRNEDVARLAPWTDVGQNALRMYNVEMGLEARPDNYQGFTATPGYDFRMQQGMDAVQGSVAARQGLLSGAALKGVQEFGQNLGTQEYSNYLARLRDMAGFGQSAAAGQGATSQGYAGQMGQNTVAGGNAMAQGIGAAGNASAAGTVGAFNALGQGVSQAVGGFQQRNMLNAFSANPKPAPAWSNWIF